MLNKNLLIDYKFSLMKEQRFVFFGHPDTQVPPSGVAEALLKKGKLESVEVKNSPSGAIDQTGDVITAAEKKAKSADAGLHKIAKVAGYQEATGTDNFLGWVGETGAKIFLLPRDLFGKNVLEMTASLQAESSEVYESMVATSELHSELSAYRRRGQEPPAELVDQYKKAKKNYYGRITKSAETILGTISGGVSRAIRQVVSRQAVVTVGSKFWSRLSAVLKLKGGSELYPLFLAVIRRIQSLKSVPLEKFKNSISSLGEIMQRVKPRIGALQTLKKQSNGVLGSAEAKELSYLMQVSTKAEGAIASLKHRVSQSPGRNLNGPSDFALHQGSVRIQEILPSGLKSEMAKIVGKSPTEARVFLMNKIAQLEQIDIKIRQAYDKNKTLDILKAVLSNLRKKYPFELTS